MGYLSKFKKWLSIGEAAQQLSAMLSEPVSGEDVLRLGLDGYLQLSTRLINGTYAREWLPIQESDMKFTDVPSLDGKGVVNIAVNGPYWAVNAQYFKLSKDMIWLEDGLWDLPMLGAERLSVQQMFQQLTFGPEVELVDSNAVVQSDEGRMFQIQERFDRPPLVSDSWRKDFFPAASLPIDSELVVRTKELINFELRHIDQSSNAALAGGVKEMSPKNWPWGAHETRLLRYLAEAAERFWTLYDPTDLSTAPTNQQVIDWLQGQKVSLRNAEVIATILRADGIPPGPRK